MRPEAINRIAERIARIISRLAYEALKKTSTALVLLPLWQGWVCALDVTIAWEAVLKGDLSGYRVYYDIDFGAPYNPVKNDWGDQYSVDGGNTWIDITTAPPITVGPDVTEISIIGLTTARDYFFSVKAFNLNNLDSPYSREIHVIPPSKVTNPAYNRGWGITSGDFEGFAMYYNSNTDPGITPTLGPEGSIPSLAIPGYDAIAQPLVLEPSGVTFTTPIKILFPIPGYLSADNPSIGLFQDGSGWSLAWDGLAGTIQNGASGWLDGEPQYLDGDPMTIEIHVRHFSGVQAAVPSPPPAASGGGGSGGGGGCFISVLGGQALANR